MPEMKRLLNSRRKNFYSKANLRKHKMDNDIKEEIRKWGITTIAFFKKLDIIKEAHTGKIVCELNCNGGKLTTVKISPEIHA
jgi:ACT domain-containing protein